jgi:hypothetical protein
MAPSVVCDGRRPCRRRPDVPVEAQQLQRASEFACARDRVQFSRDPSATGTRSASPGTTPRRPWTVPGIWVRVSGLAVTRWTTRSRAPVPSFGTAGHLRDLCLRMSSRTQCWAPEPGKGPSLWLSRRCRLATRWPRPGWSARSAPEQSGRRRSARLGALRLKASLATLSSDRGPAGLPPRSSRTMAAATAATT